MQTLDSPEALQAWSRRQRRAGRTVGLVPTMGYLHAGHASLMDALRPEVDALVVSIYVNPLQFGAGEDLEVYPRDPEGDASLCRAHGVDAIFSPGASMYPDGFQTSISVHEVSRRLCGASRPGHFEGVATVCTRLFGLSGCDVAIFGEKDFQQLAVLKRLVADLGLPVEVRGAPIVRDADGLALSSRNVYLGPEERQRALSLSRSLEHMGRALAGGERRASELLRLGREALDVDRLDYLEVVDAHSLEPVERVEGSCRAVLAAFVGGTRLIDNAPLEA